MKAQEAKEVETVELELSDPQWEVFLSTAPLTLDMAGQRAGKSQMIGVLSGYFVTHYPTLKGFVGANTYLQLTQSTLIKATEIWAKYYQITEYDPKANPDGRFVMDVRPPAHFKRTERYKDYNNIISFWNGAVIYVGSLDNYKAHDGKEFAWAHLDETKDTKKEALTSVILARLSGRGLYVDEDKDPSVEDALVYLPDGMAKGEKRNLRAFNPVWIHTSPAIGNVAWLTEMFDLDQHEEAIRTAIMGEDSFFLSDTGKKKVVIFGTQHNRKNLPENYIENRLLTLSDNEAMKLLYGYPFSKTGGEYYPSFSRLRHVNKGYQYQGDAAAHLTLDFNVLPYMTLLAAQVFFKTRWVDASGTKYDEPAEGLLPLQVMVVQFYREYCLPSPNNTTDAVARRFLAEHEGWPALQVFYYGDASGKYRIAGMGAQTNFKDFERVMAYYISEGSDRVGRANVGVLKRRELLNKISEGKIPNVEVYFDESMKETIRDFEFLKMGAAGKLKETTKDPQTGAVYEKIGHTSDAAEYLLCAILKQYL